MLEQIRDELGRLIGLPAEIDEKSSESQVGVDFVKDEQAAEFERRARGVLITKFMKSHRQQIAFQALRHTYIDTDEADKRSMIEYYFLKHPDYREANRYLLKLKNELTPAQIPVWKEQMIKIIRVMHPSLKIRIDREGRIAASFLSLMVPMPVMGLPIGERDSIARQVREAVSDIAPGFA